MNEIPHLQKSIDLAENKYLLKQPCTMRGPGDLVGVARAGRARHNTQQTVVSRNTDTAATSSEHTPANTSPPSMYLQVVRCRKYFYLIFFAGSHSEFSSKYIFGRSA